VRLSTQSAITGFCQCRCCSFRRRLAGIPREGREPRPRSVKAAILLHYSGFRHSGRLICSEARTSTRTISSSAANTPISVRRSLWLERKTSRPPGSAFDRLSLALHTDSGIYRSDTTIGTLALQALKVSDSGLVFPHESRARPTVIWPHLQRSAERSAALYEPHWNRRARMKPSMRKWCGQTCLCFDRTVIASKF
jgi:hypothetical protein